MFRAVFLLCIVAIGVRCVTGQSDTPYLKFKCESSGDIVVNISTPHKSIFVSGKNSPSANNNESCSKFYQPSQKLIITKCKMDNPVTLFLMTVDQQHGEKVVGGEGFLMYELNCYSGDVTINNPSKFEIIRTASPSAFNDKTPKIEGNMPDSLVTMSISPNSPVVLGTLLNLTIQGPDKFAYLATECKALDPVQKGVERILITNGRVNTTTGDPYLMTDFTKSNGDTNKVSMKSTIHAFHFEKGTMVTFQCTISVCNDASTCGGDVAHMASKQKRSSDVRSETLKATIVVYDHIETQDRSAVCNIGFSKWLTVSLSALAMIGCHARLY